MLSWRLDSPSSYHDGDFVAKNKQADKALLAVVKICIALYYESYFLEGLSEQSITSLKRKFAKRPGTLVQLGFGLHAGKAVEGAIGSQRKLDATYLSEAVELSEFLESSTKKYGVNILMSGKFCSMLHQNVKEMCRKIDHVFFSENYEEEDEVGEIDNNYHMSLHTFDMDIYSCFEDKKKMSFPEHDPNVDSDNSSSKGRLSFSGSLRSHDDSQKPNGIKLSGSNLLRRMSVFRASSNNTDPPLTGSATYDDERLQSIKEGTDTLSEVFAKKLELPEGTLIYSHSVWHFQELRSIRR